MNDCKYLMVLNSTFCRLKGQENPRCKNCSLRNENKASAPAKRQLAAPGWMKML